MRRLLRMAGTAVVAPFLALQFVLLVAFIGIALEAFALGFWRGEPLAFALVVPALLVALVARF